MSLFSSIANWAGNNLGTIANVGGTLLGYQAAQDAAKQNAQAMNNLGTQAAAASEFKPYSVTTGLGRKIPPNNPPSLVKVENVLKHCFKTRVLNHVFFVFFFKKNMFFFYL